MSPEPTWRQAFLATSALLREPLEVAVAALGGEPATGASALLRELASPSKDTRARAIARITAAILTGLDGTEAR